MDDRLLVNVSNTCERAGMGWAACAKGGLVLNEQRNREG